MGPPTLLYWRGLSSLFLKSPGRERLQLPCESLTLYLAIFPSQGPQAGLPPLLKNLL